MKIDLTSLIYLFGAIQALLLVIGININKPFYSDLKKITSILLVTMMLAMVYYVVILNRLSSIYPYIDSLGNAAWMGIAPSYYLLILCIQEPKWKLSWKHLRYYPLSLLFMLEGLLTTLGIPVWFYGSVNDPLLFLDIWMAYFFCSGFYFIVKCVLLYHAQEEEFKNKSLAWFSYLYLGILSVFAIVYMFIRKEYASWFELSLIALFEGFIFVLVFKTFKIAPFRQFFELVKYDNHVLTKKQQKTFAEKLEKVMEDEKPFLDKKLSLNELSKLSGINANDLSQLFNIHYRSNFYEFINRYRLSHLEKMIIDPQYEQYKIIALAEESGFNSKATFYKVFKEKHQLTPSQFIKKYKEK